MVVLQELGLVEAQMSNGAKDIIEAGNPYVLDVTVIGNADLLFHAWNIEAVAEKASAAKGSKAKKTDDLESYVHRDADGNLGIPCVNLSAAIAMAGKFERDPRSSRKSMFDLCKAGIIPLGGVMPFDPATPKWDYEHAAKVNVQRAGVTRVRPAMRAGWKVTFSLLVTTPEYFPMDVMAKLIGNAGRLCGLCDFRPTYGRFSVANMTIHEP